MLFQSTLPRGERPFFVVPFFKFFDFNPRSHEGSDQYFHSCSSFLFRFQSTLPRGERLTDFVEYPFDKYFNPRSHEGSDCCYPPRLCFCIIISIHAPTRGATVFRLYFCDTTRISIHAPTRGATCFVNVSIIFI